MFSLEQSDCILVFERREPNDNGIKKSSNIQNESNGYNEFDDAENLKELVELLFKGGLDVRVYQIHEERLGIFINCPTAVLYRLWAQMRISDFVYNVGTNDPLDPPKFNNVNIEKMERELADVPRSTRIYLITNLITSPKYQGGLGLSWTEENEFSHPNLKCLLIPHNENFTKKWLHSLNNKALLSQKDLLSVRDEYGEQIAFYFAFLQFYFLALIPPSLLGLWMYLKEQTFSYVFGIFQILWGIAMTRLWNAYAAKLARQWGTNNIGAAQILSPSFVPDRVKVDKATGEGIPNYSSFKRWIAILCVSAPFILVSAVLLMLLIFIILGVEVLISQYYHGPGKQYLIFAPTILYVLSIPTLSGVYHKVTLYLNKLENHKLRVNATNANVQKMFILIALIGFLDLLYYAFVVIPSTKSFSSSDSSLLTSTVRRIFDGVKHSTMGPDHFVARYFYYMVTAQVVNVVQELIVPYLMAVSKTISQPKPIPNIDSHDLHLQEIVFVKKIIKEIDFPVYSVFVDYAEMVMQYGYLILFSSAWPLAPFICLINNFFEIRSDAIKLVKTSRLPIPVRQETIGPWIFNLIALTWLSSITQPLLISLFKDWDASNSIDWKTISVTLLVFEHVFFLMDSLASNFLKDLWSGKTRKQRETTFANMKSLLQPLGIDISAGIYGGDVIWRTKHNQTDANITLGLALVELNKLNTNNQGIIKNVKPS